MGISWTTFTAQIVNLFILAWVLRRFLYRPVVELVEKRQAAIKAKLESAEQAEAEAKASRALYEQKLEDFEDEKSAAFIKVEEEMTQYTRQKKEALKEAMLLAEERLKMDILTEHNQMRQGLRNAMAKNMLHLVRRVLRDLRLPDVTVLILNHLATQIDALKAKDKSKLAHLIKMKTPIRLKTSAPVSTKEVAPLKRALQRALNIRHVDILLEVDDRLIMGGRLTIDPYVLDWTIEDYLNEWDVNLMRALADIAQPEEEDHVQNNDKAN